VWRAQELRRRLVCLHVEFVALDDGCAEAVFGGKGPLSGAAACAEAAAGDCENAAIATLQASAALGPTASAWVELPDPLAAAEELEASAKALGQALSHIEQLSARRLAAVERAKAAMETRAEREENNSSDEDTSTADTAEGSPGADTAEGLLANALANEGRVDFPTLTAICERLDGEGSEDTEAVVGMLTSAIQSEKVDTRRLLKALTVANELLYNGRAREALAETLGLLEKLRQIHCGTSPGSSGEDPAAECVRMLSLELWRQLGPIETKPPSMPPAEGKNILALLPKPNPVFFGGVDPKKALKEAWHRELEEDGRAAGGTLEGSQLQLRWTSARRTAEALAQKLTWHQRHAFSASSATPALDGLFGAFDELTSKLAHLHEELMCLDVDSGGVGGAQGSSKDAELPALLLAAAQVQNGAVEWKCTFMAPPEAEEPAAAEASAKARGWGASVLAKHLAKIPQRLPFAAGGQQARLGELAAFLEEAIAVGDGLEIHCFALAARREEVVEALKAAIEVQGCSAR